MPKLDEKQLEQTALTIVSAGILSSQQIQVNEEIKRETDMFYSPKSIETNLASFDYNPQKGTITYRLIPEGLTYEITADVSPNGACIFTQVDKGIKIKLSDEEFKKDLEEVFMNEVLKEYIREFGIDIPSLYSEENKRLISPSSSHDGIITAKLNKKELAKAVKEYEDLELKIRRLVECESIQTLGHAYYETILRRTFIIPHIHRHNKLPKDRRRDNRCHKPN